MKKFGLLLLAGFLALPVLADEKVDRTVDADPNGQVDISNVAGSVDVSGWSRDSVQVTGTIGPNVKELIVEQNGDTVTIKVKVPKRGGSGINSHLQVKVPTSSSLDIGTVSANIDVEGVDGDLELAAVSGEITAEVLGRDVSAESVSGDVRLRGNGRDMDIEASSVSGNVLVDGLGGEAQLEAVSGNVRAKNGHYSDATLETVTGNIDFQGSLTKGAELAIDTVNGDVDIVIDGKLSADVDISTLNGRIRNCFGHEAEKTSKYGPGWELEFTAGGGDAEIDVSTLNGGVKICEE